MSRWRRSQAVETVGKTQLGSVFVNPNQLLVKHRATKPASGGGNALFFLRTPGVVCEIQGRELVGCDRGDAGGPVEWLVRCGATGCNMYCGKGAFVAFVAFVTFVYSHVEEY